MENRRQLLKLIVVLFFSTAFIFSFSQFSSVTFGKSENLSGKYSNGTRIGTLDISGKTEADVINLLKNRYEDWQRNTKIQLQYQEKTASIDLTQFSLDVAQTVHSIKNGQVNPAFIMIDRSNVQEQLEILFPQLNSKDFNLNKLTKTLSDTASRLTVGTFSFNLYQDFMLAGHQPKELILSSADVVLNKIPADLQSMLNKNQAIEIPANSTFSLLDYAGKEKVISEYSLNVLATAIYQAVLPSNFSILQRNISDSLPAYATLGYEAWADMGKGADFMISNPNPVKYTLEIQLINDHLQVSLKGEKFLYTYKTATKDEQKIFPKTIIQFSPLLLPGKVMVKTYGKDGQVIKVYRETYDGNQLVKTEMVSEDYYPPVYQVELHGLDDSSQGNVPASGTAGAQTGAMGNTQASASSGGGTPPAVNPGQQSSQTGSAAGGNQPVNTSANNNSTQKVPTSPKNSSQNGKIIDSDDLPGKSDDLPK